MSTPARPEGDHRRAAPEGGPAGPVPAGGIGAAALAVVVPVWNDAQALAALLPQLEPLRAQGATVVVADGGSTDGSAAVARAAGVTVVAAPRGRALQMNAGAVAALQAAPHAEALWFLHADSQLPPGAGRLVLQALQQRPWGRFDVRIAGRSRWLPMVAALMNARSRLTGIATGDQGLFLRRSAFEQLGGYAPIALMEDIELSRRLKRLGPPACLRARIATSGRRWDRDGALRTIALMWWLRLRYALGAPPEALRRRYEHSGKP